MIGDLKQKTGAIPQEPCCCSRRLQGLLTGTGTNRLGDTQSVGVSASPTTSPSQGGQANRVLYYATETRHKLSWLFVQ